MAERYTPPYPPYDPTDKEWCALSSFVYRIKFDWIVSRESGLEGVYASECAQRYETVVKRWPVIVTSVIDRVYRANHDILSDPELNDAEKTAKVDEGKRIIETASKLKYEMARDRPLDPLPEDGHSDYKEYNDMLAVLENEKRNTWFTAPWLFAECYLYRLFRSWFARTELWKTYDPFFDQKCEAFQSSGEAVYRLAQTMHELESERSTLLEDHDKLKIIFVEMLQICLWGNATDLSLLTNLTHEDIQKLQTVEKDAQAERAKFILRDDSDKAWDCLKSLAERQDKRVDIVLDNSGFELFTDLLFADFLLTYTPWVDRIVFHPKSMPWFVSDVTPQDFSWTLDILSGASDDDMEEDDEVTKKDPAEWFGIDASKSNAHLAPLIERWKQHVATGRFKLRSDDFWTHYDPYYYMPEKLKEDLRQSGFVVLKGDLNYRKLTGDVRWPTNTTFEDALGPLNGAFPLLSLRGCKADVVVGVSDEEAARAQSEDPRWRVSGRYALVSFAARS